MEFQLSMSNAHYNSTYSCLVIDSPTSSRYQHDLLMTLHAEICSLDMMTMEKADVCKDSWEAPGSVITLSTTGFWVWSDESKHA